MSSSSSEKVLDAAKIKAEALRLGFSACGLAPADAVDDAHAARFRRWIGEGNQAGMEYLCRHEEKRLDPRLLVEGARTVVSLALNYYPEQLLPPDEYQIAWYAYGQDYHDILKTRLSSLLAYVRQESAATEASRAFCDTAPLLERYWAWRAGLGWIGKNTQLLLPRAGSCFFLAELVLDVEADRYDLPHENRCGTCSRCLSACPTKALKAAYELNAAQCLSYLTIEHRGPFPSGTSLQTSPSIYGCDECQKSCPWNRFASPCQTAEFRPSPALQSMTRADWHQLREEQYASLFKGSAVKRAKYAGLMRNIRAIESEKPLSHESGFPK